jgi:anti-anti-sigma factor
MVNLIFKDANTVQIFGSVDFFCVEQIKAAVCRKTLESVLIIDMREVWYIDSAGLGMLIFFHKEFTAKGIAVQVLPSEPVKRILDTSDLASLFMPDQQNDQQDQDTSDDAEFNPEDSSIHYYDCLESDTRILSSLLDRLFDHLAQAGYCEEEANEIVVAFDEAVTNALFETIKETGEMVDILLRTKEKEENPPKIVVVTWRITPDTFTATVIDHGSGLDLKSEEENAPDTNSENFLQQVSDHQVKSNLHVTINGEAVEFKRLGMGLKIMTNLMDSVHITLIDPHEAVSKTVNSQTMGTILTLRRARRLPRAGEETM